LECINENIISDKKNTNPSAEIYSNIGPLQLERGHDSQNMQLAIPDQANNIILEDSIRGCFTFSQNKVASMIFNIQNNKIQVLKIKDILHILKIILLPQINIGTPGARQFPEFPYPVPPDDNYKLEPLNYSYSAAGNNIITYESRDSLFKKIPNFEPKETIGGTFTTTNKRFDFYQRKKSDFN
jgi:hypothetical protein